MAKKKQVDISKYCKELIGKQVKYNYVIPTDYDDPVHCFHGRIVRVRLEILEEETGDKTLRSPNLVEFDNGEVNLFE